MVETDSLAPPLQEKNCRSKSDRRGYVGELPSSAGPVDTLRPAYGILGPSTAISIPDGLGNTAGVG